MSKIIPATTLLDIAGDLTGHRERREKSWYGYTEGHAWGSIPFSVSYLYRGQTAHHSPLRPALTRHLHSSTIRGLWSIPTSDQAKLVLRFAQASWFAQELAHHPVATHAKEQRVTLDPIALAQHYGIPTEYLDLTDDFDVSAFFATCRPNGDRWEPVEDGVGIIYRIDLRAIGPDAFERFSPLGPQQLPRPTEQSAWITELPLNHSAAGLPSSRVLMFEHNKVVSEHFFNMFKGGEALFPQDPLASVASEILECQQIPETFVEGALEALSNAPNGLSKNQRHSVRTKLSQTISLIENRRLLTDQQISSLLENAVWRDRTLGDIRVHWRTVRRVPILP